MFETNVNGYRPIRPGQTPHRPGLAPVKEPGFNQEPGSAPMPGAKPMPGSAPVSKTGNSKKATTAKSKRRKAVKLYIVKRAKEHLSSLLLILATVLCAEAALAVSFGGAGRGIATSQAAGGHINCGSRPTGDRGNAHQIVHTALYGISTRGNGVGPIDVRAIDDRKGGRRPGSSETGRTNSAHPTPANLETYRNIPAPRDI